MNLKGMLEGIQTAQPFYDTPDGYHIDADHDQIWLAATNQPMTIGAVQKMIDAGWFQEDAETGGEDFAAKHYDPKEPWTCYT